MASPSKIEPLLDEVRARLRPTPSEQRLLARVQAEAVERLERALPSDVEIGLVGSGAKGTALRGNNELDLFLLFPDSYSVEQLRQVGLSCAQRAMRGLPTEKSYAQHPYLKAHLHGVKLDIVPSYKIEDIAARRSAVDRSQLHLLWVNPRLDARKRDDVRLLKQFAKALGVYGAQTRVEGFSGYLCELLILHHGSFSALLQSAQSWKHPVLDPAGHHLPSKARALFPDAPLVVIDPTDPARNVSAVVSRTSLYRFALAARAFLAQPSRAFFFKEKEIHGAARLRRLIAARGTATLLLAMPSPPLVEDVLWPQLRKTSNALAAALSANEFRLLGQYFYSDPDTCFILFETMEGALPAIRRAPGPPVWQANDVERFVRAHRRSSNVHVEHERVVAIAPRPARTPEQTLRAALRAPKHLGLPPAFLRALKAAKWGTALDLLRTPAGREVASDYFTRHL